MVYDHVDEEPLGTASWLRGTEEMRSYWSWKGGRHLNQQNSTQLQCPTPGGPSSCFWDTRSILTPSSPEELIPWLNVTGSIAHALLASFSSLSCFIFLLSLMFPSLTSQAMNLHSVLCLRVYVLKIANPESLFIFHVIEHGISVSNL